MPLVMGIDSSTQSSKIEVRDLDTGELVESAKSAHPITTPPRSEQDPEAWWRALAGAISQLGRREVAAISVGAQQHGMVALDSRCEVIRPAKLWNDTESGPQAERLHELLGTEGWVKACGSTPVASLTITKLAWLKENEPEAYARLARIALPHDWLTLQMTGEFVTDRGDASGTGYWSPFTNRWAPELLAHIDESCEWLDRLPRVLGPGEVAGEITAKAAEELGIAPGAIVAAGTGDNMAGALGLGLKSGEAAISIGTSGTAYSISSEPVGDETGLVAGFADATGAYLPLVCTLNATKVTDTFARILGVEPEWLGRMAVATEQGAKGVTLTPYLDGERTPNLPHATGTLAGIRTDTTAEQFARAAFEGVVNGLLNALAALDSAMGTPAERIILTGGGSRSPAYQKIFAQLAGRPVHVAEGEEHVALGAAVQAAAALSGEPVSSISGAWGLGRSTQVG
ncbi:MAG: xylulokinase [Acidobacteria bacterium]|nr:MAG: xylulokinase [Acidobacteriota bacterium]